MLSTTLTHILGDISVFVNVKAPFFFPKGLQCFGIKLFLCELIHMSTHARVSGWKTVHEHKQALAWQALSHAKGHYLAAVSSNRGIAGWETDPGSVPSLQGSTIWQPQRICVPAVCMCARTYEHASVCVSGGLVYQTPSEIMHATTCATTASI